MGGRPSAGNDGGAHGVGYVKGGVQCDGDKKY